MSKVRNVVSDLNDEALMLRVKARDMAAFTAIYDRYIQTVYSFVAQMLGAGDADEVVQDVFLQLWTKAEQFDPARGTFVGWFMTAVRHHALDHLRGRTRQQRAMVAETIDTFIEEMTDPSLSVEEEVWLRQRGEAMLEAFKTLPEEQRRALTLAYFGGLSHSEIAQQLNWPLGTVKKRIQLGLQKLRHALAQGQIIETKSKIKTTETDAK